METTHVVECFWPGVDAPDLDELDSRVAEAVRALEREGVHVAYRGSWLLREDEVVLCFFNGSRDDVTAAARRAAVPYERIHEGVHAARTACLEPPIAQLDRQRSGAEGQRPGG